MANALRAAILTRKLAPGEKLPSGNELASRYGVARMTVQQAIRLLRDEGQIVSRQGSGGWSCASAPPGPWPCGPMSSRPSRAAMRAVARDRLRRL